MLDERVIVVRDAELDDKDLVAISLCPECLSPLVSANDDSNEVVCSKCGLVVEGIQEFESRIPFNETRKPACSLATDNSLGSSMSIKDLFKVYAHDVAQKELKCPKCGYVVLKKSVAIPIFQIKTLMERQKHPIIERMDKYGSKLIDKWLGPIASRESKVSQVFAQTLGNAINKVGLRLVLVNDGYKAKKMTEATFLWIWAKMQLPNIDTLRWGLWPKTGGIPEIREVNHIMSQIG